MNSKIITDLNPQATEVFCNTGFSSIVDGDGR